MRRAFLFFALVLLIVLSGVSWSWDYVYDGSVLPNDPSLGAGQWAPQGNLSMCSTDGNVLHINDTSSSASEGFSRGAESGPITMESRVRVGGEPGQSGYMGIGTSSFSALVGLHSDHLTLYLDYGESPITYSADLTTFHALRVAINAQGQALVWLDQTLVAQGVTNNGGQGNVRFGGSSWSGVGQSYWDYVAYSNEFLPIPEPSSLLALAGGLAGIAGLVLRRRRG